MQEDNNKLFKEYDELKKEIMALRLQLNSIDAEKEAAFGKKGAVTKEISDLIKKVKELKIKRDDLTKQVKSSKEKRKELNDVIVKKIEDVKKVNSEKESFLKKFGLKEAPSRVKEEIDRLEMSIETSGMSFEKEKETMKVIKNLKKRYDETKEINALFEKSRSMSKEIDKLKDEAEEVHQKVQKDAAESQRSHEEMLELSKKVDELKPKEEDAYKNFFELKQKFSEVNNSLKEKLGKLNEAAQKLGVEKERGRSERRGREENILRSKEEDVMDKIRKGGKLTTEDLIVFQGMKE
ncbi:MAG: hypothetical protein Q7J54_03750 [Candidatus Woesearchaeota archaeon]|nr:hypothetical protein [Candidatus Woesearchaeota archaeon]